MKENAKPVSISSPSSEGGGESATQQHWESIERFPLVLLQAKVVGTWKTNARCMQWSFMFPLVLLQAKVVGKRVHKRVVSVLHVSISSPSSEGGGYQLLVKTDNETEFPLVLLQAKAVGVGKHYKVERVKLSKLISRIINPFIEPARLQNRT